MDTRDQSDPENRPGSAPPSLPRGDSAGLSLRAAWPRRSGAFSLLLHPVPAGLRAPPAGGCCPPRWRRGRQAAGPCAGALARRTRPLPAAALGAPARAETPRGSGPQPREGAPGTHASTGGPRAFGFSVSFRCPIPCSGINLAHSAVSPGSPSLSPSSPPLSFQSLKHF